MKKCSLWLQLLLVLFKVNHTLIHIGFCEVSIGIHWKLLQSIITFVESPVKAFQKGINRDKTSTCEKIVYLGGSSFRGLPFRGLPVPQLQSNRTGIVWGWFSMNIYHYRGFISFYQLPLVLPSHNQNHNLDHTLCQDFINTALRFHISTFRKYLCIFLHLPQSTW